MGYCLHQSLHSLQIEKQFSTEWDILEINKSSTYKDFVDTCNKVGSTILPPRKPVKIRVQGTAEVKTACDVVLSTQPETVPTTQAALCDMYDETQGKWFHNILEGFDKGESISTLRNAWNFVKHLSGNKSKTVFVQGENSLDSCKTHFQKLLSSDT